MTPTFTKALERASTFFERPITLRSLRDPSKKAKYTEPRHFVTAYLRACQTKIYSYPQIARIMHRMDHATIMNSMRRSRQLWPEYNFAHAASQDELRHQCVSLDELIAIGAANLWAVSNAGVV